MSKTNIEWVRNSDGARGETWNPITGCAKVSEGCKHCYAERMAHRLAGRFGYPEAPDHFDVTLHLNQLDKPLKWKKPRTVFVCSMGDLFHEKVHKSNIACVFNVARRASQHTFMFLTKRPLRMKEICLEYCDADGLSRLPENFWLGVTAENQATADERIPLLLQTPAAMRFVSVEPMLGPLDLQHVKKVGDALYHCEVCYGSGIDPGEPMGITKGDVCPECSGIGPLDWVIVGGESGPGARPMHPGRARGIRDQCQAAGVPFFFKGWGAWFPRSQWEGNPSLILPDDCDCIEGPRLYSFSDDIMHRVGKKAAGRLLDDREWSEMPPTARREPGPF